MVAGLKNIDALLQTCKLRLQPPSGSDLPAHNPFLPPAAITQVMLIANPNKVGSL
jgi:ADP-ribosylation factor-binding protein GGA